MIGKNSFKNLGPKNYSLQIPLNILLVSKSCLVENSLGSELKCLLQKLLKALLWVL